MTPKLTPLQQKIITYLTEHQKPATFYDLMVLGVTATVAAAVSDLIELGVLEKVEAQNVVCVRLKNVDTPVRLEE